MPSQITHILHAQAAAGPWLARHGIEPDDPVFRLGCQGPDIFYHNRRTKPGAFLYGTRLHQRGYGQVSAGLVDQARQRGWGRGHPGLAFLAGWLAHAALDREAHPFVVYFSGWAVPGRPETKILKQAHAFFERTLDVLLYEHLRGQAFSACRLQSGLPAADDLPDELFEAWAASLAPVFPQLSHEDHVTTRLRNAVDDTSGFLGFTDPQNVENARRAARAGHVEYFHPVDLPPWDFLNLERGAWRHPVTGAESTETFVEIFDRAVEKARRVYEGWDDPATDWRSLVGDASLNLPDEHGVSRAPSHSRPWDYAAFYDRQRRSRLSAPAP